ALCAVAASVLLAAGTGLLRASPARAAEAGVNVSNPSAAQLADIRALGTHWVRMFVSWPMLEPARGAISPSGVSSFEQIINGLPAGTKVILDVFGSPQWETGSADEHTPPANPNDYAAFVGALAQRPGS